MNETNERLRRTFETAADIYDAARPAYPEELFDDLVGIAGLEPRDRLLEIGCATGKATRPLLRRGFSVVCVEIGAQLAERAARTLAGFPTEIHVSAFEEWEGESGIFDLVYAATAWHWIEPSVRYPKAHRLLRPGGHLAFWSALHAFPRDFDRFFSEIQLVYDEIGERHPGEWPPPLPEEIHDNAEDIQASGLFDDIAVRRYVWETQHTAEEYIALLSTFSGHIAMEAGKREYLYGEVRRRVNQRHDGRIRRHWASILHVARRMSE